MSWLILQAATQLKHHVGLSTALRRSKAMKWSGRIQKKVLLLLVATTGEICSFVSVFQATEDSYFFDRWIMEEAAVNSDVVRDVT